jgi:hypothetical protein
MILPRHTADAERHVEPQRARRYRRDVRRYLVLIQPHDGSLAELLLDLPDGQFQRL